MKNVVLILVSFLFIAFTIKTIDIGKYTFEVEEVINKKTVWEAGGAVTAKNKHKYVGVKAVFTPKDKKDNSLNVDDFTLHAGDEEYAMTIPKKQDVFFSGANMIKVRKPKKKSIIAVVPKSFKEGALYYKDKKIGKIICDNDKGGSFLMEE